MRTLALRRALLVVPAAVLPLASVLPAQASTTPGWHVQSVISTGTGTQGLLLDVSTDSPGDAWAVGLTGPISGSSISPLIVRWNGTSWAQVALPAPILTALGGDLIDSVSAASPKNVWMFGFTSTWLHYDGATWTSGHLGKPGPTGETLTTATLALSKSDVWAFGARVSAKGGHSYAAHFDGVKWTATPVPGSSPIRRVSAVRAGDIWAVEGGGLLVAGGAAAGLVGAAGRSAAGLVGAAARSAATSAPGGLVHWSGGTWHSVRLPATLRNVPLSSVVASSDSNVWVGGSVRNAKKGTTEAVGHWNGHGWTVRILPAVTSAQKFSVSDLALDGSGGLWAVGNCFSCTGDVPSRIWHESAGRWQRAVMAAKSPFAIVNMALVPGGTSVWGVGAIKTGKTASGLVALDGTAPR